MEEMIFNLADTHLFFNDLEVLLLSLFFMHVRARFTVAHLTFRLMMMKYYPQVQGYHQSMLSVMHRPKPSYSHSRYCSMVRQSSFCGHSVCVMLSLRSLSIYTTNRCITTQSPIVSPLMLLYSSDSCAASVKSVPGAQEWRDQDEWDVCSRLLECLLCSGERWSKVQRVRDA